MQTYNIDISGMSSMTESWIEIYPHFQFLISYVLRPSLFFYSQLYTEQKIGKNRNRVKPLIMDRQKVHYLCTADRSLTPGRFYHKTTNLQEVDTFSNILSTGKGAKCREALQHIADIAADLLYICFVFLDFLTLQKKQNSVLHEIGDRQLSSQMRS